MPFLKQRGRSWRRRKIPKHWETSLVFYFFFTLRYSSLLHKIISAVDDRKEKNLKHYGMTKIEDEWQQEYPTCLTIRPLNLRVFSSPAKECHEGCAVLVSHRLRCLHRDWHSHKCFLVPWFIYFSQSFQGPVNFIFSVHCSRTFSSVCV